MSIKRIRFFLSITINCSSLYSEISEILQSPIELSTEAELSVGIAKITAKTKDSPKLRSQLRQYLEPRTSTLLESINQELFDQLDGEIEYMADDSEDHDEYTKQSKVISSVETAQKIIKILIKRTKDYEIKEATNIAKKEDESQVLTFKDLKKKLDISDIQKILPDKKKKEMK